MSTLTIAGRTYKPISHEAKTAEYRAYMGNIYRTAGLGGLLEESPRPSLLTPKAREELVQEALRRILAAGLIPQTVAGCLSPVGGTWSAAWAEQEAVFLDGEHDRDARGKMSLILMAGIGTYFLGLR